MLRRVRAVRYVTPLREGGSLPAIVEAHSELMRLTGQAPTYNFDPGLLVMQIGGLLASAGAASQRADA